MVMIFDLFYLEKKSVKVDLLRGWGVGASLGGCSLKSFADGCSGIIGPPSSTKMLLSSMPSLVTDMAWSDPYEARAPHGLPRKKTSSERGSNVWGRHLPRHFLKGSLRDFRFRVPAQQANAGKGIPM
ncbi:hypothetical protein BHM03_00038409 [Ensete ventricosum]|nr:hypothetical protein BHM03_00038409 [Ensete ventricosum]